MTTDSKVKQIVILGAAGTGLLIAESISRSSDNQMLGFLDDDVQKQARGYHDLPVLGGLSSWTNLPDEFLFLTSLYGANKNVHFCQIVRSLGIPESRWATIIDPCATASAMATLGYGTYIGPGSVLEPLVHIGNYCAILGNVYIGHDSNLSDYVACANSVSLAGRVSVHEAAFIGANSTVREDTHVGARAVVGMGSVVLSDVADGQIVVGNPARPLRKHQSELNSPDSPIRNIQ